MLAAELVGLNVDVIVTVDTPPTQAAQQATRTIPIVIAENRNDAWHHGTADVARPRRRGDRIGEGARQSWRDQPVQVRPR
jgi:hypothetical protein